MNIVIRTATPEDALGIIKVRHDAWLATYVNEELGITADDIEDRFKVSLSEVGIKKQQDYLRVISPNEKRLVAMDGDLVVGAITMIKREEVNQLQSINVLPEYQGNGIGTMLWNEVKDFVDPTKKTIVQVATHNTNAIKFYEKFGFVDNGKRFAEDRFKLKSGAVIPELEMELKK